MTETRIMIPVSDFEEINQQLATIDAKLDVLFLLHSTGDAEALREGALSWMLSELQQQAHLVHKRLGGYAGERMV